jgi:hypothetical protein
MINIYDEPSSSTTSTQVLIDIDLAKKLTSLELIATVRDKMETVMENQSVILFMVGDTDLEQDYSDFVIYLKNKFLTNENCQIYYRGHFHLEFLNLLEHNSVFLSSTVRLVYDAQKLHRILSVVKEMNDRLLNKFIERFISTYHRYGLAYLPITELNTLNIDYETF